MNDLQTDRKYPRQNDFIKDGKNSAKKIFLKNFFDKNDTVSSSLRNSTNTGYIKKKAAQKQERLFSFLLTFCKDTEKIHLSIL